MKIVKKFKDVTVAGIFFPEENIAFYCEGSRRWDTRVIRRAAKKAIRQQSKKEIRYASA